MKKYEKPETTAIELELCQTTLVIASNPESDNELDFGDDNTGENWG